jgi:hypothetical protein
MNLNTLDKAIDASRRAGKPPRFKEFPEPAGGGAVYVEGLARPKRSGVVGNMEVI